MGTAIKKDKHCTAPKWDQKHMNDSHAVLDPSVKCQLSMEMLHLSNLEVRLTKGFEYKISCLITILTLWWI